ncbi:hypothetical protein [Xenorhabdus szentirmaii]|uniref:hypothetical protein n=1 Tax=Xenorhabdus szentirmaii TaxID=290112 RepID=UPI000C0A40B9|nr:MULTISPECIES: hypothetical protein [Xenorhabdus]PHM30734.1 hypothetical protein Xsze_03844 [Xenorhabdus szentirmaii DSM 16338]
MKSILYALLLSAFYIPSVFAGLSTADTHSKRMQQDPSHQGELRKCTDLLPEGHEYTISIIGTSDKKNKNADGKFTGKFEVSDETKQPINEKRAEEIKPFIQCVTERVL